MCRLNTSNRGHFSRIFYELMMCWKKSFELCIVLRGWLYILNDFRRIISVVPWFSQKTVVRPIFWLLCLFYPSFNIAHLTFRYGWPATEHLQFTYCYFTIQKRSLWPYIVCRNEIKRFSIAITDKFSDMRSCTAVSEQGVK